MPGAGAIFPGPLSPLPLSNLYCFLYNIKKTTDLHHFSVMSLIDINRSSSRFRSTTSKSAQIAAPATYPESLCNQYGYAAMLPFATVLIFQILQY